MTIEHADSKGARAAIAKLFGDAQLGAVGFIVSRGRRGTRGRKRRSIELLLKQPGAPIDQFRRLWEVDYLESTPIGAATPTVTLPWALTGLHAGAPILTTATANQFEVGAATCVLGKGGEPTHLLTAGHLFPYIDPDYARALGVFGAASGRVASVRVGSLVRNFIDLPPAGVGFAFDAALVELSPEGVALAKSTSLDGRPVIGRVQSAAMLNNLQVRAYSPEAGGPTKPRVKTTFSGDEHSFASDVRGDLTVRDVVRTSPITVQGESGTLLYVDGAGTIAVGMCVGETGVDHPSHRVSVFEPVETALQAVGEIDNELEVWPDASSTQ